MTGTAADIAIVGVAGCYAGAADVRRFWQNILDKVDAVGPADDEWTGPYLDPDSDANDRIYTNHGGFLRDLAVFNPAEFGIMPSSIDGGEPDHYLALKLARDALRDAGYERGGYDPERAGVILGRGTYVNRGYTNVMQHGLAIDQTLAALRVARPDLDAAALQRVRDALKAQLPPFNAEMAPGVVPNVTTGIIANRLDLMGPNYIIDAACASSLVSVELAARELHSGRCDLVLAGGVQAHTPPQLFMTFCQIGALSRGRIRPFSAEAGGTLLGEGAGMMVLKRLADAEAAGDRIYAVVKGIGTASDGRAKGLLAPRLEGEVLALERAYRSSGIDPASVGLIEAHGTGIPLGDQTEVQSLTKVFGERQGSAPTVALGSVKSMISHCIPAAGSAALIKSALALHHRLLPPTLCEEVNPALGLERTPFYINTETRPWIQDAAQPRRAGINAFGFGGINAHVVLEEHRPAARGNQVAMPRDWPGQWHAPAQELLLFAAADSAKLRAEVSATLAALDREGLSLAGLARALAQRASAQAAAAPARLALVAGSLDEAATLLQRARDRLADGRVRFHNRQMTLSADEGRMPGKLVFLFPGEGAQYAGMLRELAVAFPQVREWFDFLDGIFSGQRDYRPSQAILPPPNALTQAQRQALEKPLFDMDLASESVFAASQAFAALLRDLGLRADMMLGHSTGENSALIASGTVRDTRRDTLAGMTFDLNALYRQLDEAGQIRHGRLLTVGALDAERRRAALAGLSDRLWLAMDNCPNQVVLFGADADIAAAHEALTAAGGVCAELPFGRAYHTPLFQPVADAFRPFYQRMEVGPGEVPLYSCASAEPFPQSAEGIRELACGQWAAPVRFVEAIERLYADGARVFLEVGPSANLAAFAQDILREREDVVVLSCNSRRQPDVRHFLGTLGRLWTLGAALDPEALFAHRDVVAAQLDAKGGDAPRPGGRPLNLQLPSLRLTADMLPALPSQSAPGADAGAAAGHAGALPAAGSDTVEAQASSGGAPGPAAPSFRPSEAVPGTAADRADGGIAGGASPPMVQPAAVAPAAATAVTTASGASDPAAAQQSWVRAHFELMQRFLESQQRVWAAASAPPAMSSSVPSPVPAPAAAADDAPLLGAPVQRQAGCWEWRKACSVHRDRYLADHCIGGAPSALQAELLPLPVVPFTFSMAMVAEGAMQMAGGRLQLTAMEEIRGHRWLALESDPLPLRVVVEEAEAPGQYLGRIYHEAEDGRMPGGILVFEARLTLAASRQPAPSALPALPDDAQPPRVNCADRLYSQGMFHGPRLQGVREILRVHESGIEAELEVLPSDDYFAGSPRPRLAFDAALLDAAGQLAGYWLSERQGWQYNCFPFKVARFAIFAEMPPPGTRLRCRAAIAMTGTNSLEARFDLLLPDGGLLATAQGWQDRVFHVPEGLFRYRLDPQRGFLSAAAPMPLPAGWVARHVPAFADGLMDEGGGIWRNMLAHMACSPAERPLYGRLQGARREEWLLGRVAAKEAARLWLAEHYGLAVASADVEIVNDDQGAPSLRCAAAAGRPLPAISIAHSGGHAVACALPPGLAAGIDYQRPESLRIDDVARGALAPAEQALLPAGGDERNATVLAFWAAKEAAAKATGSGLQGRPQDWLVASATLDARGNGSIAIQRETLTLPVLVTATNDGAALALAASGAVPEVPAPSASAVADAAATLH